ncbi:MAG: phage tail assembly chaperone [Novosphingobium sp.]
MTERFGPGALRLSALAAQLLGWRPAEFWAATPAELAAILSPGPPRGAGITRGELARMMEREP